MEFVFLGIGVILGLMTFRLCWQMGWHWSVGITLGLIPVAGGFLCGIYGLLGSALFVGALYKASAKMR